MGFQATIANALLEVMAGCVDCEKYDRQVVTLGDPTIECSTLGIGLQSFNEAASVGNECAVHDLRMNAVIALCCVPVAGNASGTEPPDADEITRITGCVADDVERIICCLRSVIVEGLPGAVNTCKPRITTVTYSRPSGGCVVAKIGLTFSGVPCCD